MKTKTNNNNPIRECKVCGNTFRVQSHGSRQCCSDECSATRKQERDKLNKLAKSSYPPGFKCPPPPKTYKQIQAENRRRRIVSGWRGQKCMGGCAA